MSSISHNEFQNLIAYFEKGGRAEKDGVSFETWVEHFHACDICSDAVLVARMAERGVNPSDYACVHMAYRATDTCDQHPDRSECHDMLIEYYPKFDEYALIKGQVSATIHFCPWCGVKLPPSQRDRWFDELEALGVEPWSDDVPEPYKSGAWFKQARTDEQS